MSRKIVLFNCYNCYNCYIEECKEHGDNNANIYNYTCGDNIIYPNTSIKENIYLPNVKKNMFINFGNKGRYGNYIYTTIYLVACLLEIENIYSGKSYDDIVREIKENILSSKLYSVNNCKVIIDEQSGVPDKYYFDSKGISSFKYFDCHHFSKNNMEFGDTPTLDICEKDIDIIIYLNEKVKIYVLNDVLYFVVHCIYIVDFDEQNVGKFDNVREKLLNLFDFGEKPLNFTIKNDRSMINNPYIQYILQENTIIDKNHARELLNFEIEKCFNVVNSNKMIVYITELGGFSFHDYQLDKTKIELVKAVKEIILEDENKKIATIYEEYQRKYIDKILVVAHFRGGDFESTQITMNWKVLKPCYYIKMISSLLQRLNTDGSNILLLCCFHPNDNIFYAYSNIIKYNFPNINIKLEREFIDEFPESKFIFMDEPKHILFMSLFRNMIKSNSTYANFVELMNLNIDQNIFGGLICYGSGIQKEYCGMGIGWKNIYDIFYCIFKKIENASERDIDTISGTYILSRDDFNCSKENINVEFYKHVIFYDTTIMKILLNGRILQITLGDGKFKIELMDGDGINILPYSNTTEPSIFFERYIPPLIAQSTTEQKPITNRPRIRPLKLSGGKMDFYKYKYEKYLKKVKNFSKTIKNI